MSSDMIKWFHALESYEIDLTSFLNFFDLTDSPFVFTSVMYETELECVERCLSDVVVVTTFLSILVFLS